MATEEQTITLPPISATIAQAAGVEDGISDEINQFMQFHPVNITIRRDSEGHIQNLAFTVTDRVETPETDPETKQ